MKQKIILARITNNDAVHLLEFETIPEKLGENPQAAMRAAVKEYLSTDEGKQIAENNGDDFNWGDAILNVPAELWEKYGLRMVTHLTDNVIVVNHDENLYL
jgi:hypothetical protein